MTPIERVLKTWYPEDHPLHLDPLYPAIGLAGEAGELLSLYKKERFKGGFSWWDCVHCGKIGVEHNIRAKCNPAFLTGPLNVPYTPKNLDELGDFWYYLRILAYQKKIDLSEWTYPEKRFVPDDMFMILAHLNSFCAKLLLIYEDNERIEKVELATAFSWFQDVLFLLDYTIDKLTELNWRKLEDGDNNGWATARKLP